MSVRVWFARDTGFTADPKVQLIGDKYGPGGPLVLEEMMALAKLTNNGGSFETSYPTLARRAFTTPGRAREIVAAAACQGIIEGLAVSGKEFSAQLTKWARWNPKDPGGAAVRKSRQRERERHEDVTP